MIKHRIVEKKGGKDNGDELEITVVLHKFDVETRFFLDGIKKELTDELIPFQLHESLKWQNPGFKLTILAKDYKYLTEIFERVSVLAEEQLKEYEQSLAEEVEDDEVKDEGEFEYFEQSKVIKGEEFSMFELPGSGEDSE